MVDTPHTQHYAVQLPAQPTLARLGCLLQLTAGQAETAACGLPPAAVSAGRRVPMARAGAPYTAMGNASCRELPLEHMAAPNTHVSRTQLSVRQPGVTIYMHSPSGCEVVHHGIVPCTHGSSTAQNCIVSVKHLQRFSALR